MGRVCSTLGREGAPEKEAPQTMETPVPEVNPATDALLAVDVQYDFLPGGALGVPDGDRVIAPLNRWLGVPGLFKIASRDWHPPDHCSFQAQGGPWPPHCVRGTRGAEFHESFLSGAADLVVSKATKRDEEAYSAFDSPDLAPALEKRGVRRLWIGGLATDYCVLASVLDARKKGLEAFVIEDAVQGIDAKPGDCEKAVEQMLEAGAVLVRTDEVLGG